MKKYIREKMGWQKEYIFILFDIREKNRRGKMFLSLPLLSSGMES